MEKVEFLIFEIFCFLSVALSLGKLHAEPRQKIINELVSPFSVGKKVF